MLRHGAATDLVDQVQYSSEPGAGVSACGLFLAVAAIVALVLWPNLAVASSHASASRYCRVRATRTELRSSVGVATRGHVAAECKCSTSQGRKPLIIAPNALRASLSCNKLAHAAARESVRLMIVKTVHVLSLAIGQSRISCLTSVCALGGAVEIC